MNVSATTSDSETRHQSTRSAHGPIVVLDGTQNIGRDVIGGKAAGITAMRKRGFPVPPAFALTTIVCSRFQEYGERIVDELHDDIAAAMRKLENDTGRTFGAGPRPLLVSVRSGAAVSMPGMMDTVLNLGMTPEIERMLADEGGSDFASRTRQAFEEQFSKVVGIAPPSDPWDQLRAATVAVFKSWRSPRALAYRKNRRISNEGGTAVTIQAMVYGNLSESSGTGVLFSRNPLTGAPEPYGEWLPGGQGEDIVSGRFTPKPLTDLQIELPDVYSQLLSHARALEELAKDVQDIEFTVERGKLWLLQTRSAKRSGNAAVRFAVALFESGMVTEDDALELLTPEQVRTVLTPVLDPAALLHATELASGLPACPGVASGTVYDDPDAAEEAAESGAEVILARETTSPDDVHGIIAARAIITELGGGTSHAAVVSREIHRPCVVGCGPGSTRHLAGKVVTVDGANGKIYDGRVPVIARSEDNDEDLATLLRWLRTRSPLQGWRSDQAPEGSVEREGLDTDTAIRAAITAGVTDVVVEHPLPLMLQAWKLRPAGGPEQ